MQNRTFFNTYINSWQCNTVPGNTPQFWGNQMMEHHAIQHYPYTASAQQRHAAASHLNIFYPPNVHVGSNFPAGAPSSVQTALYPAGSNISVSASQSSLPSSNLQNVTTKPPLSFVVYFTADQAATSLPRAKNLKSDSSKELARIVVINPRNSAGCKFAPCQWQGHSSSVLPSKQNHDCGGRNRETLLKEYSK